MVACDLAQRDEGMLELWLRDGTTGDLDQLSRRGREEAQSTVLRDVQTNARTVGKRRIDGNEAELGKLFEATGASQSVAQHADFGAQLCRVVQRHQITTTAAPLNGAHGLNSVGTRLEQPPASRLQVGLMVFRQVDPDPLTR